MLRLAIFLLLVHVAAGRLQADSGGYNDGFQLGAPPDTLQGAKSRDILQLQARILFLCFSVAVASHPLQYVASAVRENFAERLV